MTRPHILVIDDDETVLITTRGLLEAEGYEVSTHPKAFGASSMIHRERPDLILLDVNMPGLSGTGLAQIIRENPALSGIKVLLHSANDVDALRIAVKETGADGYVCKGDPGELRQTVAHALKD